jgi:hypothetical protein
MNRIKGNLPQVQSTFFVPSGGMDQITPALQLRDGACREMQNFEQGIRGGYRRISGYERWANNRPTDRMRFLTMQLSATSPSFLVLCTMIEGASSGARALFVGPMTVDLLGESWVTSVNFSTTPTQVHVAEVAGQFQAGEPILLLTNSGTTATNIAVHSVPVDLAGATVAAQYAQSLQNAEDVYRRSIVYSDQPYATFRHVGLGSIDGVVYAFAVCRLAAFPDIERLEVRTPVVTDPRQPQAQGRYLWNAVAVVVIDGSDTIFPTAPGYIDLVEYNFSGASNTRRLYGASGAGKAFAFDGTAFTAITTGMAVDHPTRIAVHKNRLFLAFGASLQFSTAADPTAWSPVTGAGEISMGESITAMGTVQGGDASSALVVGTERGLAMLYGDLAADFNLVWISREMGMRAGSLQFMSPPIFINDYGVTTLAATDAYGNFQMSTISESVQPFIMARLNRVTASALVRSKNQYRVFFDDGTGLIFTFQGRKLAAITPVRFDRVVRHCHVAIDYADRELVLFTSDDGVVYRMEVGRNFDGQPIDAYLLAAFNHLRAPRMRKAFRRLVLELQADGGYVGFEAGADVDYGGLDAMQSPASPVENHRGALWDEFTWDDFVWDTSERQPTVLPVDGSGKNVALFIRSYDRLVDPFTLTGVMTDWIARRQER